MDKIYNITQEDITELYEKLGISNKKAPSIEEIAEDYLKQINNLVIDFVEKPKNIAKEAAIKTI